jgi:hypothetical protein
MNNEEEMDRPQKNQDSRVWKREKKRGNVRRKLLMLLEE